jgi:hypothetical protein
MKFYSGKALMAFNEGESLGVKLAFKEMERFFFDNEDKRDFKKLMRAFIQENMAAYGGLHELMPTLNDYFFPE